MINLEDIRHSPNQIVVLGSHEPIIQSILDFDYLSGNAASIVGIVTGRRGYAKYFFGRAEILVPTLSSVAEITTQAQTNLWFLNLLSGRRTLSATMEILKTKLLTRGSILAGGVIFAEGVPELHAVNLIQNHDQALIVGPASVGLIIPGVLKLGPIGGITPEQIKEGALTEKGHVAVLSASGGMTNELINIATQAGHHLSFALSFGGDRFPILSPRDAFLLAEEDPQTKAILYYGELGGEDEYELVKLKEAGKFTKQVVAHIAGTVASLFPESPQFGHAKAKADKAKTTAIAKREALTSAGFQVSTSFLEFSQLTNKLK
jgi:succinyl-CoA synthetase alpha subunit